MVLSAEVDLCTTIPDFMPCLKKCFKDVFVFILPMSILTACVHGYHMCAQCPQRSEEAVGSPGAGVTEGGEPPCGCWD